MKSKMTVAEFREARKQMQAFGVLPDSNGRYKVYLPPDASAAPFPPSTDPLGGLPPAPLAKEPSLPWRNMPASARNIVQRADSIDVTCFDAGVCRAWCTR